MPSSDNKRIYMFSFEVPQLPLRLIPIYATLFASALLRPPFIIQAGSFSPRILLYLS